MKVIAIIALLFALAVAAEIIPLKKYSAVLHPHTLLISSGKWFCNWKQLSKRKPM
jgi:hypothetical protein